MPPDTIASFTGTIVPDEEWIVQDVCAYVPQSAWLRNASIRDNILFDLPYVEERYQKTLEVCALLSDLRILEDGDMSEIGERGVNLSGGQAVKRRESRLHAPYILALQLSFWTMCSPLGDLMRGRTIILVSHHVQLCSPSASYIVALDNGRVQFQGDGEQFKSSGVLSTLVQSGAADASDDKKETLVPGMEEIAEKQIASNGHTEENSETGSNTTTAATPVEKPKPEVKKVPRKLIEEEKRRWEYWSIFALALIIAALSPVLENGWLQIWSGSALESESPMSPTYYITVYAAVNHRFGLVMTTLRYFVLYHRGIHASIVLYRKLLEGVLFANIRFHDTVSRGRLLNRFGKDFEALFRTTLGVAFTIVGGLPFLVAATILGTLYYQVGKVLVVYLADNEIVGGYAEVPTGQMSYDYNILVYSNDALVPGFHTFTLINGHVNGNKSLVLLDYAMTEFDDLAEPLPTSSSASPSSSSQLSSRLTSEPSSSVTSSSSAAIATAQSSDVRTFSGGLSKKNRTIIIV
ncbi:hypothetical protein OBBRIDRAFT_839078 [Obba rivulosa]|uniref:ABC transmembrane type-1 domain-containing protein n=1 Tax=Obba rivulosa TaxID=1052685 RepID=A0A8E2AJD4_9APHY|nr:hypothetical protein OBBRIDRAFT_839078 [Obba rivulosa]